MNKTKAIREMMKIYKMNRHDLDYDLEQSRCRLLEILSPFPSEKNHASKKLMINRAWLIGIEITANEFNPEEFEFDESVTNCLKAYYKFSEVMSSIMKNRAMVLECIWTLAQISDISFEEITKDYIGEVDEK